MSLYAIAALATGCILGGAVTYLTASVWIRFQRVRHEFLLLEMNRLHQARLALMEQRRRELADMDAEIQARLNLRDLDDPEVAALFLSAIKHRDDDDGDSHVYPLDRAAH